MASPLKLQPGSSDEWAPPAPAPPASAQLVTAMLEESAPARDASHPPPSTHNESAGRMLCQVAECTVDLRQTKPYCIKKRLCPEHLNAQAVKRRGSNHGWWRFCQQCGKLEPLEAFDGGKRSCRARLQKRRAHNTAKTNDSQSFTYNRASQQQRGGSGFGGGDQKRQRAEANAKVAVQYADEGHDHCGSQHYAEGDYVDVEGAGVHGAGEAAADMEVYSTLAGQGAGGVGLDPAAAAAAVAGYRGPGVLAAAVGAGDYHGCQPKRRQHGLQAPQGTQQQQQQQQQASLLQSILLANGMANPDVQGNPAVPAASGSQAADIQDAYTAAAAVMATAAAAAAAVSAAAQPVAGLHDAAAHTALLSHAWSGQAADVNAAWGDAVQHSSSVVDPAASAAVHGVAPPHSAALAAVCAALAEQQQQQQQQALRGSMQDLQQQHYAGQERLLEPVGEMQRHNSMMMIDAGLAPQTMSMDMADPAGVAYQDSMHHQQPHEDQQPLQLHIKQEVPEVEGAAAAVAAASAAARGASGDVSAGARHAQLVGMLGQVLDQMGPKAGAEPGTAAAAMLAAAAQAGLASLSGESVATAAAVGAAAAAPCAAASSAAAGYSDAEAPGTATTSPSPESAAVARPDAAAAAAALVPEVQLANNVEHCRTPLDASPAAAAAAGVESVPTAAAASAACAEATIPNADSLAGLGHLLQMGAGLCTTLGTAGTSASSQLSQEVSTRLLTAIFAQAPAAAATLMLAQQQQLQQLQLQQQQLVKMVMQQQEQLQQQQQQQEQLQQQQQEYMLKLQQEQPQQQAHVTPQLLHSKQQHQQKPPQQGAQQQQIKQQPYQHSQLHPNTSARLIDPFDALLAAAAAVDDEEHDHSKHAAGAAAAVVPQPRMVVQAKKHHASPRRNGSSGHLEQLHCNNGSSMQAGVGQANGNIAAGHDVVEVVSAQLQTMAKQIAAALAPIQSQMGEFQAELQRMKGSDDMR